MNWEMGIRWLWLVLGRNSKDKPLHYRMQTWYHFALQKHSPILEEAFMHIPAEEVDEQYVGTALDIWRGGLRNPSPDAPFWEGKDRLCDLRKGSPPIHIFAG